LTPTKMALVRIAAPGSDCPSDDGFLDVRVVPGYTAADLKEHLARLWQIPAIFQKLRSGLAVLDDAACLATEVSRGGRINLVISFEDATRALQDPSRITRIETIRAFARLGPRGRSAIAEIIASLQDEVGSVRCAAVDALGQIAERDDATAMLAVSSCLQDSDDSVRMMAVMTLSRLATRGDDRAVAAVSARMEHQDVGIRIAGMKALASVATKGDGRMVALIANRLEDVDATARSVALGVLAQIAFKGNQVSIAAASACLEDKDELVRNAAMKVVAQLAERGDAKAVAALEKSVREERGPARCTALRALGEVVTQGDDSVSSVLMTCLKDEHPLVRRTAVEMLGQVVHKGSGHGSMALLACLESDSDGRTRCLAAEALGKVAKPGDQGVVKSMDKQLHLLCKLQEDPFLADDVPGGLDIALEKAIAEICGPYCPTSFVADGTVNEFEY